MPLQNPGPLCSGGCRAILLLLLIERMEVADHLVEAGGVKMRIDLGGLNTGMAEQLLQHAQIGTARVHVGGKRMPQHVR